MAILTKIISLILALINSLLLNLGIVKQNVELQTADDKSIVIADKSESTLLQSAEYAANLKNDVQGIYTDTNRSAYKMSNAAVSLTHKLTSAVKTAELKNNGGSILAYGFRTFYTLVPGLKCYFENSLTDARVNTIRLGEYYYDCHIRDLESTNFKVDKNYHIYSDRLYMQYTLLSETATAALDSFGCETDIDEDNVESILVKDKNGYHSGIDGIDSASVEFIAFDIKDAGIVGFIIPSDGTTASVKVIKGLDKYTVVQTAAYDAYSGINDNTGEGGYDTDSVTFGCRVYTDDTHSFDGIKKAAYEERNPLENIVVEKMDSNAAYVGYDSLRGMYTLKMEGIDFQSAYDNPYRRYNAGIKITSRDDRNIYVRAFGTCGCLEAAVLLDENNTLQPMDVQVCKNFQGDGGESFYSPNDYQYGDAIFPLSLNADEEIKFTLVDLYQNWGQYPLKQLSSIEFHVSYYHLSTGTTESNCIAPYFVYGKDGWILPDFRTRSGIMWAEQPQFNSVGTLRFMVHENELGEDVYSEFSGSDINSTGPVYSDINDYYTDDCGKYTYTLRHVEMPQTDENRTYYSLNVKFNEDVTYEDFENEFALFSFDGRFVTYKNIAYLNSDNVAISRTLLEDEKEYSYELGKNGPFLSFYNIAGTVDGLPEGLRVGCNFGLLIKNSKIISCGKETDIPFVFKVCSAADCSSGELTLKADSLSFKKGDTIDIDLILLPWGTGNESDISKLLKVREDSVLKPATVESENTVVCDSYIPTVAAENNKAEFTVSGGRNNIAVKVNGFTSIKVPDIYILNEGKWEKYEISSECGYDGYEIQLQPDGKYSFSFIYSPDNPSDSCTFKVEQ